MKTSNIFAALAIPATALGLFAQENITIREGKAAAEGVMLAQGAVGMVGLSSEQGNFRFVTQEFSFSGRPVIGQPYSADEKTESVQTLADGNRISNTTTAHIYRDSQGRTRREMTLPGFGGDQPHTLVTISDPVAGVNYTFDPESKVAHQMPGPQAETVAKGQMIEAKLRAEAEAKMKTDARVRDSQSSTAFIRRGPAPTTNREDLGDNVLEGVSVKGTRESSTIEAGAMGNERPITITSERWFSPDLQVEVKSLHSDPRMGQTTHTLTNINRSEPDAALFRVPSDYSTEEGKPGVQIRKFEYHNNQ
jgi:hypothetical protein